MQEARPSRKQSAVQRQHVNCADMPSSTCQAWQAWQAAKVAGQPGSQVARQPDSQTARGPKEPGSQATRQVSCPARMPRRTGTARA